MLVLIHILLSERRCATVCAMVDVDRGISPGAQFLIERTYVVRVGIVWESCEPHSKHLKHGAERTKFFLWVREHASWKLLAVLGNRRHGERVEVVLKRWMSQLQKRERTRDANEI